MHSTHAHPLPHGRDRSSSQSIHSSNAITSPNTLASQQQNEYLSHQTRRLQLRNAGFRGAMFPTRRISPLFSASPTPIESVSRQVSNENTILDAEKRSMYGEDLPPSPVNILQEIQKSTRKKRSSPRPGFGAIFQDNTRTEGPVETSWYREGSRECSLAANPNDMMKLREGSGNRTTPPPPLNSPMTKQRKGRNVKQASLRSTSSEASKYIEHLEFQLAAVNAKLDSLTSPNTSKLRSAKLRALTVDNRNLRQEVSAWEKQFAARVQEERDQRLEVEMELKVRLRTLENDIELRDARIAELEWETESMRVKVGDAEGLAEVNLGLERRIEILTNLLAQSPTKLDICSPVTSPVRGEPIRRTARPKSMLPSIPTPSAGLRLSLSTVSESAFWQPSHTESSSSLVESPSDALQDVDGQDFRSVTHDDSMRSPVRRRQSRESGPLESTLRASDSFRSAPSSTSRPTSFRSSGSFGPTSWGLPHVADNEARSACKQRKMRKFPSGSVSLRPLILPAATVSPLLPASAHIDQSIDAIARREISESSIDPTTSFLSKPEESSPATIPNQHGPRRSTSWAHEQTMRALEGRSPEGNAIGDAGPPASMILRSEEKPFHTEEVSSVDSKRRRRPRSLQKELEEAENEQAREVQALMSPELFGDSLAPVSGNEGRDEDPDLGQSIDIDPTPSKGPLTTKNSRRLRLLTESEVTPKPEKKPTLHAYRSSPPVKATPSTMHTTEHAFGIFARLTNLISRTKQDPLVLARRILSNAWAQGSRRLGGVGWWLLGLVYGTRWRKRKQTADSGTVEPTTTQDFDWSHFTAEASRRRTVEYYFRDYGTCHQRTTDSWLSPPHASDPNKPPRDMIPQQPTPLSQSRTFEPHLFPCNDCVEPSSRRTLRLWFQFSLAIVLAVGMAIKHGPASLLSELPEEAGLPTHAPDSPPARSPPKRNQPCLMGFYEREPLLPVPVPPTPQSNHYQSRLLHASNHHHHRHRNEPSTLLTNKDAYHYVDKNTPAPSSQQQPSSSSSSSSSPLSSFSSSRIHSLHSNGLDSGYGSITFAETLGPADFEAACYC